MILESKSSHYDANGLFRTICSYNPTRYLHIVGLTFHQKISGSCETPISSNRIVPAFIMHKQVLCSRRYLVRIAARHMHTYVPLRLQRSESGPALHYERRHNSSLATTSRFATIPLLHRYGFCQVSWLIYITAFSYCYIISKQLKWNNRQ